MSLSELIAGVEEHELTLTVYNTEDVVSDLRERFADRNLAVETGETDAGPERFVALDKDGRFVGAAGLDELLEDPEPKRASFDSDPFRPILDQLDETLFTSYSRSKVLAASREIEDRAWRVGKGQLHAGFQRVSTLVTQLETYSALGARDALTVHTYATPDTELPKQDEFVIHTEETNEIANTWFVAFDGAGLDTNKCALVAEERAPGEFYGFWTYDPDTVEYIITHLSTTYLRLDADGGNEFQNCPPR